MATRLLANNVIAHGYTKMSMDLELSDTRDMLEALTELRSLLPDATLHVGDDLDLILWSESDGRYEFASYEAPSAPLPLPTGGVPAHLGATDKPRKPSKPSKLPKRILDALKAVDRGDSPDPTTLHDSKAPIHVLRALAKLKSSNSKRYRQLRELARCFPPEAVAVAGWHAYARMHTSPAWDTIVEATGRVSNGEGIEAEILALWNKRSKGGYWHTDMADRIPDAILVGGPLEEQLIADLRDWRGIKEEYGEGRVRAACELLGRSTSPMGLVLLADLARGRDRREAPWVLHRHAASVALSARATIDNWPTLVLEVAAITEEACYTSQSSALVAMARVGGPRALPYIRWAVARMGVDPWSKHDQGRKVIKAIASVPGSEATELLVRCLRWREYAYDVLDALWARAAGNAVSLLVGVVRAMGADSAPSQGRYRKWADILDQREGDTGKLSARFRECSETSLAHGELWTALEPDLMEWLAQHGEEPISLQLFDGRKQYARWKKLFLAEPSLMADLGDEQLAELESSEACWIAKALISLRDDALLDTLGASTAGATRDAVAREVLEYIDREERAARADGNQARATSLLEWREKWQLE